jgi:uncharacterized membrane protein YfcA
VKEAALELWNELMAFRPDQLALLFVAAMTAGAVNSVAGGGSFFSFPTLLVLGVPDVRANATNTTAMWLGSVASVGAYRRELATHKRSEIIRFSLLSLFGGWAGARLLLAISDAQFAVMVPFLLLAATLIFAFSPQITRLTRKLAGSGRTNLVVAYGAYLIVALYGGFFGAGLGILTLAVLALLGQEDIHRMNALKTLQAALINGIAAVTFMVAGAINIPLAVLMTVAAVIGGYFGAEIARRISPKLVRNGVIVFSVVLTLVFFWRQFGA